MLPFGIGIPEVLMILVVVLLVVGPSKLPELARTVGKGLRLARRAGAEIRNALDFDEPLDKVQREWVDPIFEDEVAAEDVTSYHDDDNCAEGAGSQTVSRGSATSSPNFRDNAVASEVEPQVQAPTENSAAVQSEPVEGPTEASVLEDSDSEAT